MATTEELSREIMNLKDEGKKASEIAEELNARGITTPSGLKVGVTHIHAINSLSKRNKPEDRLLLNKSPKSQMLTIPVNPSEDEPVHSGKLIAVIGDFEDVQKLINGWMR